MSDNIYTCGRCRRKYSLSEIYEGKKIKSYAWCLTYCSTECFLNMEKKPIILVDTGPDVSGGNTGGFIIRKDQANKLIKDYEKAYKRDHERRCGDGNITENKKDYKRRHGIGIEPTYWIDDPTEKKVEKARIQGSIAGETMKKMLLNGGWVSKEEEKAKTLFGYPVEGVPAKRKVSFSCKLIPDGDTLKKFTENFMAIGMKLSHPDKHVIDKLKEDIDESIIKANPCLLPEGVKHEKVVIPNNGAHILDEYHNHIDNVDAVRYVLDAEGSFTSIDTEGSLLSADADSLKQLEDRVENLQAHGL